MLLWVLMMNNTNLYNMRIFSLLSIVVGMLLYIIMPISTLMYSIVAVSVVALLVMGLFVAVGLLYSWVAVIVDMIDSAK